MKTTSKLVVLAIVATMIIFTASAMKSFVDQNNARLASYSQIQ